MQVTYKCSKEQIHTHMKNTFIHIQGIQVNKAQRNVAKNRFIHKEQIPTHMKNTFIHIQGIQVNKTHTNVAKNKCDRRTHLHSEQPHEM